LTVNQGVRGSIPRWGANLIATKFRTHTEKLMYNVIGKEETFKVLTLAEAMNLAKHMNEFVVIKGTDFEVVGKFGVDTIADGVCPDGVKYDWNKANRIGRVKRERV
jgi:hypothetical protein